MKQIKLPATLLLVLVTALVLAAGTPVFAHGGEHESSGSSSSSDSNSGSGQAVNRSTSATNAETEHGTEVEVEHQTEVKVHRSSIAELKTKAQDDLAARKSSKKLTDDQRKQVCENHKQGLKTKFDRIVKNSQRIQTRVDGILQKATDYKTSANLNPDNWDSLLAAAQSAQSASNASIATLQSVKPTVDCNNKGSVAADVATFKAAAAETRDNLKTYRDSVKAVLKSLADAKQSTAEGSN